MAIDVKSMAINIVTEIDKKLEEKIIAIPMM